MKDYELTVVFHPDLEMNLDPALDKVKKIITGHGGTIIKEENEGKKRLSYAIKGQDFGIYYFFNLSLPNDAPGKISTSANIADEILRYLLVRADERKAKYEARRKERASSEDDLEPNETNKEKGE